MEREIPDPGIQHVWVTPTGGFFVMQGSGCGLLCFFNVRRMLRIVGCEYLGEL